MFAPWELRWFYHKWMLPISQKHPKTWRASAIHLALKDCCRYGRLFHPRRCLWSAKTLKELVSHIVSQYPSSSPPAFKYTWALRSLWACKFSTGSAVQRGLPLLASQECKLRSHSRGGLSPAISIDISTSWISASLNCPWQIVVPICTDPMTLKTVNFCRKIMAELVKPTNYCRPASHLQIFLCQTPPLCLLPFLGIIGQQPRLSLYLRNPTAQALRPFTWSFICFQ